MQTQVDLWAGTRSVTALLSQLLNSRGQLAKPADDMVADRRARPEYGQEKSAGCEPRRRLEAVEQDRHERDGDESVAGFVESHCIPLKLVSGWNRLLPNHITP